MGTQRIGYLIITTHVVKSVVLYTQIAFSIVFSAHIGKSLITNALMTLCVRIIRSKTTDYRGLRPKIGVSVSQQVLDVGAISTFTNTARICQNLGFEKAIPKCVWKRVLSQVAFRGMPNYVQKSKQYCWSICVVSFYNIHTGSGLKHWHPFPNILE